MPPTSLLDTIRADVAGEHQRQRALLDDPATQASVRLAESLGHALAAAGFSPFHQQIFHVHRDNGDGDMIIFVHIYIHNQHWAAGMAALLDLLKARGGHVEGGSAEIVYFEDGHPIKIPIHDSGFRGWAPDPIKHLAGAVS